MEITKGIIQECKARGVLHNTATKDGWSSRAGRFSVWMEYAAVTKGRAL
jgi:hypothetical protein